MSFICGGRVTGQINLQATLSSSSAMGDLIEPHHPITCTGQLVYAEDGTFACDHATVPPDDERTVYCLQHSIAILIIEEAVRRFGGD